MLTQIKAAAGAGKTYTLTQYFLNLLAGASEQSEIPVCLLGRNPGQHSWQEIMAVTFTNKAAIEMKERIIGALKEQALSQQNPSANLSETLNSNSAKQWLELILRHYGSLNIRTIDSLLTMLVRLSCLNFGLAPDFKQVFNSEEYFDPVFDLLLQSAMQEDPELKVELEECCRTLLHNKQVMGFMPSHLLKTRLSELCNYNLKHGKKLVSAKQEEIEAKLGQVASALKEQASIMLALCERDELLPSAYFTKFLEKLTAMPSLPQECPSSTLMQRENLEACLNAKSPLPGEAAKETFLKLQYLYQTSSHSIAVLHNARLNASFVRPVQKMLKELSKMFKNEGFIPATLLPRLANKILSDDNDTLGPSELFCRMGNRLRHILIDEFQDTSTEQWKAILPLAQEALSQGGSLTCVGDSKQAIYAWRGGDVALFDELLNCAELTAITGQGKQIELPFNWRSAPLLVNHNNLVFSRLGELKTAISIVQNVMPEETPQEIITSTAASLQKTFSGAKQKLPEQRTGSSNALANDPGSDGLVSIVSLQEKNTDDLERRIKEHLQNLLISDILRRRPLRHVACLVRSNKQAATLAAWLAEWNLPAITENSLQLAEHPILRQTLAWLNWLNMPLDDLALFEFINGQELFGRVSGLNAAQIEEWAVGRNKKVPLLLEFRRTWPEIWQKHLAPFYNQAGLMSVYDLVCELFDRYQVEAAFPEHKVFILRFLEILFLAENEGIASLPAFLEWWEKFGKQEKVPMPDSLNAIRIITIHKAKGLEFPVVIMPFQEQRSMAGSEFLLHEEEGLPVLVNLRKDLGDVYYQKFAERVCEAFNVVYVAWTRAVNELYIFLPKVITAKETTASSGILDNLLDMFNLCNDGAEHRVGIPANVLKSLEKSEINSNFDSTETEKPTRAMINQHSLATDDLWTEKTFDKKAKKEAEARETGKTIETIEAHDSEPKRPMSWLPRLKIFRNTLQEPQFDAAARGELMHYCIEGLRPEFDPAFAAERAFNFGVQRTLISNEDIVKARPGIIKALTWLSALPEAATWFSKGISEQLLCDNHGHNFRADMVVYEPDLCTVLEFKSGSMCYEGELTGALYLTGLTGLTGSPDLAELTGLPDVPKLSSSAKLPDPAGLPDFVDSLGAPSASEFLNTSNKLPPQPQAWPEHMQQIKTYLKLLAEAQPLPVKGLLIYLDQQQIVTVNPG